MEGGTRGGGAVAQKSRGPLTDLPEGSGSHCRTVAPLRSARPPFLLRGVNIFRSLFPSFLFFYWARRVSPETRPSRARPRPCTWVSVALRLFRAPADTPRAPLRVFQTKYYRTHALAHVPSLRRFKERGQNTKPLSTKRVLVRLRTPEHDTPRGQRAK